MRARGSTAASSWPISALALTLAVMSPARAADPDARTPRMRAGHGQPQPQSQRWDPPTVSGRDRHRRLQLTLLPIYAALRVPLFGRPQMPVRGGGVQLEGDVLLIDPVWLRLSVAHTVHPVADEYGRDADERIAQTAARGNFQATTAGLGLVYGLDLGRVLPLVEVGAGAMWLRGPEAIADGQQGAACRNDGTCDAGLTCNVAANVCEGGTIPQVHGGVGIDVMLADHWSVGASFRYFALLTAPQAFPIYLTAGARLGVRF
jgi:hypothetical protein